MINHDQVEARLRRDEAYRTAVYLDSRGNPTCGIGHLIVASDNLQVGDTVDADRIETWFTHDYVAAVGAATKYSWFDQLNDARQQLIVCLEFNMGPKVFGEFHDTQKDIAASDYTDAATELLDSAWAREVGYLKPDSRGATYARILRTGVWE